MKAKYKFTVEICADKIADIEQLLCVVAEAVLNEAVTGNGGGRIGSYVFNLEKHEEES